MGLPWWVSGKDSTCSAGDLGSISGLGWSLEKGTATSCAKLLWFTSDSFWPHGLKPARLLCPWDYCTSHIVPNFLVCLLKAAVLLNKNMVGLCLIVKMSKLYFIADTGKLLLLLDKNRTLITYLLSSLTSRDINPLQNFFGPKFKKWSYWKLRNCFLIIVPTTSWALTQNLTKLLEAISSVQSLSHVPLFATPWTAAHQASLSITNSWSLLKLMPIKSVMPSNHLLSTSSPSSIFPNIRVFPNESLLHIRWPKYWNFSFSISPSNEYSELISFRVDWVDLPAVQGALKCLLQNLAQKYQFFATQLSL